MRAHTSTPPGCMTWRAKVSGQWGRTANWSDKHISLGGYSYTHIQYTHTHKHTHKHEFSPSGQLPYILNMAFPFPCTKMSSKNTNCYFWQTNATLALLFVLDLHVASFPMDVFVSVAMFIYLDLQQHIHSENWITIGHSIICAFCFHILMLFALISFCVRECRAHK